MVRQFNNCLRNPNESLREFLQRLRTFSIPGRIKDEDVKSKIIQNFGDDFPNPLINKVYLKDSNIKSSDLVDILENFKDD